MPSLHPRQTLKMVAPKPKTKQKDPTNKLFHLMNRKHLHLTNEMKCLFLVITVSRAIKKLAFTEQLIRSSYDCTEIQGSLIKRMHIYILEAGFCCFQFPIFCKSIISFLVSHFSLLALCSHLSFFFFFCPFLFEDFSFPAAFLDFASTHCRRRFS